MKRYVTFQEESRSDQPGQIQPHQPLIDRLRPWASMVLQDRLGIPTVQLRWLGARWQIGQEEVKEWEEGVILDLHNVLLKLPAPDDVFAWFSGAGIVGVRRA